MKFKYPAAGNGASSQQSLKGRVFGLRSATVGAKLVPPPYSTARRNKITLCLWIL